MQTRREALDEARLRIATGTSKAADLKRTTESQELRELAEAVHLIGYGAQQIALAFLDPKIDDL